MSDMIHLGCYFYYCTALIQLMFQDDAGLGRLLE